MPPPTTVNNFVRFSTDWKMKWSEFDGITGEAPLEKRFDTSYDNVVLHWRAKMSIPKEPKELHSPEQVHFTLYYVCGPLETFKNMDFTISVVKPDRSIETVDPGGQYEAILGQGWAGVVFEDKNSKNIQTTFGLSDLELICRIWLKIPISAFTLNMQLPPTTIPPQWMIDLYNVIDDPEKSIYWNAKLISRDNTIFYCHKNIAFQSKPLDAMFKHPPKEGKPENEYPFPGLATESMRVFLRFLYTGQVILGDISTDHLIELVDIAEQYHLKSLKEVCIIELWKVVVKDPNVCYRIIQLSDLHQDMVHLKSRAMDVLAENYEKLGAHKKDLVEEFGGGERGKILRRHFSLFQSRRLLQAFFG